MTMNIRLFLLDKQNSPSVTFTRTYSFLSVYLMDRVDVHVKILLLVVNVMVKLRFMVSIVCKVSHSRVRGCDEGKGRLWSVFEP